MLDILLDSFGRHCSSLCLRPRGVFLPYFFQVSLRLSLPFLRLWSSMCECTICSPRTQDTFAHIFNRNIIFKNYELDASSSSSWGLGGHIEVSWPTVVSDGLGVLRASSSSSQGLGGHIEVSWPRVDMISVSAQCSHSI